MTGKRQHQQIRRLTLVALVLAGIGSVQSQPKSGDWKATADFGEFTLTVSVGGSSITRIAYKFVAFRCGGVGISISGGMAVTSSWGITNNQFTITTNLNTNPIGTPWPHTIMGTFNATGEQVSGTWSANVAGSPCSGSWGPVGRVVAVDENIDIPPRYALGQNYPNPFNPTTTIQFSIKNSEFVILKVYDLLGREVALLVNERKAPGSYEVKFSAKGGSASGGDGSILASGVYFYRLNAGTFVETKKLLLLR